MLKNLAALLVGASLLVLGVMFSVVILAVAAVLGLCLWGYVWWTTRDLRRAMRQQPPEVRTPGGQVIDGEAIVVDFGPVDDATLLPEEIRRQPSPPHN